MQRTGRNANMLSRPSNDRNSACLNLMELQRGHSRVIHSRRGTHLGQVRLEKFISMPPRVPLSPVFVNCKQGPAAIRFGAIRPECSANGKMG
jgi:hypothetical protein